MRLCITEFKGFVVLLLEVYATTVSNLPKYYVRLITVALTRRHLRARTKGI